MSNSTDPTDCVYFLISRTSLAITSGLKRDFVTAGITGLRPAYLGVLLSLWAEDGLQGAELARRAGLEPSTMTGLLDRMEGDRLVERRPDPDDRRAQRIHLTPAGQAVHEPAMKVVDETLARLTQGLSDVEVDHVRKLLRQVLVNAQEGRR